MIAWSVSLLFLGLSMTEAPGMAFDHKAFCDVMHVVASLPDAQPGTVIQRSIRHGGVSVSCEERAVEIRTVLSRPLKTMGKNWLQTQTRYWRDDNCSDPLMAGAIANGWSLKATILVEAKVAASFTAACGK